MLTVLTIVGSSNAVNLTDGLDGLAIGCTVIVSFVFLILTYVAGNAEAGDLSANSARRRRGRTDGVLRGDDRGRAGVFMVQLPSGAGFHGRHRLAGAGRGAGHHRGADPPALVLMIAGGVFVMEAASVILQTGYFKYTRQQIWHGPADFPDGAAAPPF